VTSTRGRENKQGNRDFVGGLDSLHFELQLEDIVLLLSICESVSVIFVHIYVHVNKINRITFKSPH